MEQQAQILNFDAPVFYEVAGNGLIYAYSRDINKIRDVLRANGFEIVYGKGWYNKTTGEISILDYANGRWYSPIRKAAA